MQCLLGGSLAVRIGQGQARPEPKIGAVLSRVPATCPKPGSGTTGSDPGKGFMQRDGAG